MIYVKFSKWGISLSMCSETPEQPLTEQRVRRFVMEAINRTQEQGYNPVLQAMQSEVHPGPIADSLHPEMTEAALLEWIMQTEEMQEALIMFHNQIPSAPEASEVEAHKMEQEEVEVMDVEQLLLNLTVSQSDWR